MRKLLTALWGIVILASPVAAQDYKPVDVNFGFGWAFPTGDFKERVNADGSSGGWDTGWNGTIGGTFNLNPNLGLQAEYIYARMNGPDKTISLAATPVAAQLTNGLIESNHQMHIGSFNVIYKGQSPDHPVGGYVLGGAGLYHRIVQLTSPSVGYTTYCDPYWYVCYPAAVSVDQIIGDRSSNDFGIDFGGGVTFGREAKFYVESRYHYVWGKSVTPTTTTAGTTVCSSGCSTNASYFPITFGVRW
jgi:opacity protein-like surface antigen